MTKSLPPKNLVLYADDDPDDVLLVRELFNEHSPYIELVTFEDGDALYSHLIRLSTSGTIPCLVILDINMPRLNGKQTLQMIRSAVAFEDMPVVLFSTSTLPAEADFARRWGAGFINKPLTQMQLSEVFDQLIEHCPEEVKKKIIRGRKK